MLKQLHTPSSPYPDLWSHGVVQIFLPFQQLVMKTSKQTEPWFFGLKQSFLLFFFNVNLSDRFQTSQSKLILASYCPPYVEHWHQQIKVLNCKKNSCIGTTHCNCGGFNEDNLRFGASIRRLSHFLHLRLEISLHHHIQPCRAIN